MERLVSKGMYTIVGRIRSFNPKQGYPELHYNNVQGKKKQQAATVDKSVVKAKSVKPADDILAIKQSKKEWKKANPKHKDKLLVSSKF